jgi:hypothetical protein
MSSSMPSRALPRSPVAGVRSLGSYPSSQSNSSFGFDEPIEMYEQRVPSAQHAYGPSRNGGRSYHTQGESNNGRFAHAVMASRAPAAHRHEYEHESYDTPDYEDEYVVDGRYEHNAPPPHHKSQVQMQVVN